MYVGGVESGVLHNTAYRVLLLMLEVSKVVLCIQWPLAPARREDYFSLPSWGLAVHHWSVQGGSFVKFLRLVNYKGDCRQDAQPIPNS